ncbi:hypothetical protein L9F63_028063 [Diploptera punctata]|uniref:Uncharacterized protein n=1 Tax=Diploptera punctata TaxID=6984 RepID=A0AAD8EG62_DIPPU|nr:hypothetical protein L9F63_028063 [Diploptera punctata]
MEFVSKTRRRVGNWVPRKDRPKLRDQYIIDAQHEDPSFSVVLIACLTWGMDSASAARSVLPRLVLKDDLAAKLNLAQSSVSSHVVSGSRSRSLVPIAIEDLKLEDVFFNLDTYNICVRV